MKKLLMIIALVMAVTLLLGAIGVLGGSSSSAPTSTNTSKPGKNGDTELQDNHVASAVYGGKTYYYTNFDTAVREARNYGMEEITVLQDTVWLSPITINKSLTIKGANENVVLTSAARGHNLKGGSTLTFQNITINATPNWFDANEPESSDNKNTLIFDNVTLNMNKESSSNLFYLSSITLAIEIKNSTFNCDNASTVNIFNVNSATNIFSLNVTDTVINGKNTKLIYMADDSNVNPAPRGLGQNGDAAYFNNVTSNATVLVDVSTMTEWSYITLRGGNVTESNITGYYASVSVDPD